MVALMIEAVSGEVVLVTYVVDAVFQHCWNDPPDPQFGGYYRVLFRLLDVNHLENYTLNINR